MSGPTWVNKEVVLAIHDEQLAEHGGLKGIRNLGLLESALDRPRSLHAQQGLDIVEIAAACGYAITRNHPFNDSNKRVSAVVTELFLTLNGVEITATDEDVVETWLALSAGRMNETPFAAWLRENTRASGTSK